VIEGGCGDVTHVLEPAIALPRPIASTEPEPADTVPAPPAEDVRLVVAARTGDRSAFAELYRLYARMVHGVLLARLPRAEVEDLVQDVFVTAMHRIGTLREAAAFPGWLASIARNRAIDFLRRRRVETIELVDDPAAPEGDTTEALAVLAEIGALPDAYRETLILRLVEGLTGPEIATQTGMTPGSVRVNLHRGMKMLRARLEKGRPR
jgi:RNA polymerase sigma-70 factor (ECF subfamily)